MLALSAHINELNNARSCHPIKRYFISITENEAYHGCFSLNEDEIKNKCFVVKRALLGPNGLSIRQMPPSSPKLKDFVDLFEGNVGSSATHRIAMFH
jgi:hypothetical protein